MTHRRKLPAGVFRAKKGLGIRWDGVPNADGSRNQGSEVLEGLWDEDEAALIRAERVRAARAQTKRGAHVRTVRDLITAHRTHHWGALADSTQGSYETIVHRLERLVLTVDPVGKAVATKLPDIRLADLERPMFLEALEFWAERGRADGRGPLGPKTIRNTHGLLSEILGYGVDKGWLPANPAADPDLPAWQPISGRFLTVRQVERLVDCIDDPVIAMAYHTMLDSGVRPGEARALAVPDIRLKARVLLVRQVWNSRGSTKLPKGDRMRAVPFGDKLAEILPPYIEWLARRAAAWGDSYRWDLALLFPNADGTPLTDQQFRRAVHEAAYRAHLGVVNPKDARSTFATLADDETIDDDEAAAVSDSLGHRDPTLKDRFYVQNQQVRIGTSIVPKPKRRQRIIAGRVDKRLGPVAAITAARFQVPVAAEDPGL